MLVFRPDSDVGETEPHSEAETLVEMSCSAESLAFEMARNSSSSAAVANDPTTGLSCSSSFLDPSLYSELILKSDTDGKRRDLYQRLISNNRNGMSLEYAYLFCL